MTQDNYQNSLQRGVMSIRILALLQEEDKYGYPLVQETQNLTGERIVTQKSSLYPVFYKPLPLSCDTNGSLC